jgi:hypothetical protein
MERRHFLKFALGLAAGTAALATVAAAAPLMPQNLEAGGLSGAGAVSRHDGGGEQNIRPAVTSREEVDQLKPVQVHWGHGHHYGWHHRHWGWHHRHHWGWRHHHWHRHWHHRHWRHW